MFKSSLLNSIEEFPRNNWFTRLANENEEHTDDSSKQVIRQRILSKLNAQIGAQPSQLKMKFENTPAAKIFDALEKAYGHVTEASVIIESKGCN